MTIEEVIKKLDRDTLITILIAIVKEFSVVRECIKSIFTEHFNANKC